MNAMEKKINWHHNKLCKTDQLLTHSPPPQNGVVSTIDSALAASIAPFCQTKSAILPPFFAFQQQS
jgi:hypothetical protein